MLGVEDELLAGGVAVLPGFFDKTGMGLETGATFAVFLCKIFIPVKDIALITKAITMMS